MAGPKVRYFAKLMRSRRRQLRFTQSCLAKSIKISGAYISRLEAGGRHPSNDVVFRLAKALQLERRELMALLNPRIVEITEPVMDGGRLSAWEEFQNSGELRRSYKVTDQEMDMLSCVARMGPIRSTRAFVYILIAVKSTGTSTSRNK